MIFTYLVGSETSFERHFQFDGKSIGLLLTLGEIGPILTAVVISHLGSRGNRPRWMALGLFLIVVALILAFFMDFIFPPPQLADYNTLGFVNAKEIGASKALCKQASVAGESPGAAHLNASSLDDGHRCTIDVVKRRYAFASWVFIYTLMGKRVVCAKTRSC